MVSGFDMYVCDDQNQIVKKAITREYYFNRSGITTTCARQEFVTAEHNTPTLGISCSEFAVSMRLMCLTVNVQQIDDKVLI